MIANKLCRYFLLTIILVQWCWSRPAAEHDLKSLSLVKGKNVCMKKIKYDQLESTEKNASLSASLQLLNFTFNAFQNLALDSAQNAKTISENILKHPDILSAQSAKILGFKANLTQFEEKYSSCNGLEELFELVELFSNTTEHYLETNENDLDANDKLILELLRKYGTDDMEDKASNDLKEFMPKFISKFEHLKEDLNKEKGTIGQKLLQWFKEFQTFSNTEEKTAAFVDFFLLFEDAEE